MPNHRSDIPVELLEGYSSGQLTRLDIQERLSRPVRFGELLAALHARSLPLPRVPVDPASPGVQLVRRLVERTLARAG